jgi:hypothetical protein
MFCSNRFFYNDQIIKRYVTKVSDQYVNAYEAWLKVYFTDQIPKCEFIKKASAIKALNPFIHEHFYIVDIELKDNKDGYEYDKSKAYYYHCFNENIDYNLKLKTEPYVYNLHISSTYEEFKKSKPNYDYQTLYTYSGQEMPQQRLLQYQVQMHGKRF